MAGIVDIHLEIVRKFEKYRRGYMSYAKVIKKLAEKHFEGLHGLYVFGSVSSQKYHPLSDIDVAIVLLKPAEEEVRVDFYRKVRETFGLNHPFEFHIITNEEWNGWYSKFVKDFVEI